MRDACIVRMVQAKLVIYVANPVPPAFGVFCLPPWAPLEPRGFRGGGGGHPVRKLGQRGVAVLLGGGCWWWESVRRGSVSLVMVWWDDDHLHSGVCRVPILNFNGT